MSTTPQRYRKRPVVIEAMQWTGNNLPAISKWVGADSARLDTVLSFDRPPVETLELWVAANKSWLPLQTGEWIIRDELGFYPCNPAVFEKTYEAA